MTFNTADAERTFASLKDRVVWLSRVLISSCERFYWDNGFSKAASLAYTSLLSLVPVTFVIFGFLASFAIGNEELAKVREFLFRQFIPNQQAVEIILSKISEIQASLNSSNFSLLAVSFFAVTALLLINSIEYALNEIWQVFEPRTIAARITIFCAILVVGPILIVSAYYTAKLRLEPFLMDIELLQSVSVSVNHIISLLLDGVAFFALYYLVPKAPVRVWPAAFGAIVTTLLFDLAKFYFTSYLVQFTSYDKVYGALSIIPIFLFWLYITWSIILFGAQCSFQFQYLPLGGQIRKKQVSSVGDGALVLACQSLLLIGRAFKQGYKSPNEIELGERLGASSVVLNPVIELLKSAGIIARSDAREMPLLLAKSPDKILVSDISRIEGLHPHGKSCMESVSKFMAEIGKSQSSSTLDDNQVKSNQSEELSLAQLL